MLDDTSITIMELSAQGYSCAQIVMMMGLRMLGRDNPDLVRSMSALAMGAHYGSMCGALTGGLCLVALHTAKGLDDERPLPRHDMLMDDLIRWFVVEELGGTIEPECAAIFEAHGNTLANNSVPTLRCAGLVAHTWIKTLSLLSGHDIDPTLGRKPYREPE